MGARRLVGHVRALAEATEPLAEGAAGIIVDETTNAVAEVYGPERCYRDWQSAVRSLGVPLFRLIVNGADRFWCSDPSGCINNALHILMSESRAADRQRQRGNGCDRGANPDRRADTERWRELTWVVQNGEPVALVGIINGRLTQV